MLWKATVLMCICFPEDKVIRSSLKYSFYKFIGMSLDIHWEELCKKNPTKTKQKPHHYQHVIQRKF